MVNLASTLTKPFLEKNKTTYLELEMSNAKAGDVKKTKVLN
jgi:hypothetical protein